MVVGTAAARSTYNTACKPLRSHGFVQLYRRRHRIPASVAARAASQIVLAAQTPQHSMQ